jgi:hypothetical protein
LHCEERGNVKIHHLSPRKHSRGASTSEHDIAAGGAARAQVAVVVCHGQARHGQASTAWRSATAGERERRASMSTSTIIFNFFPPDEPNFDYSHTKLQHPHANPLSDLHKLQQPNSLENEFSLTPPPDQAAAPPWTFFSHSFSTICLAAVAQGGAEAQGGAAVRSQQCRARRRCWAGGAGHGASSGEQVPLACWRRF